MTGTVEGGGSAVGPARAAIEAAFIALASPLAYDTVEAWRAACRATVGRLTGADMTGFILPLECEPLISASPDLVPAAVSYERYFHQLDTGLTVTRRARGLEVFGLSDVYDLSALRKTEFYADWLRAHRLRDVLAMATDLEPNLPAASLHCYRSEAVGGSTDFGDGARAVFEQLLPAFKAGVDALVRLGRYRETLWRTIDATGEALVVADLRGRTLHRTPVIARLLVAEPEREHVERAMREVAASLAHVARSAAPAGCTGARATGPVRVAGPPISGSPVARAVATGGARYRVRGSLVSGDLFGREPVVLVVLERAGPTYPSGAALVRRFGLTRAEARVALLLAEGRSNAAIAAALGVSPHTARHHTEHLFRKLGVTSRAEVPRAIQSD